MRRNAAQVLVGLMYGVVSVVLLVGGLSLALGESYTVSHPTATFNLPPLPQTLTFTPAGPTQPPPATLSPTQTPPPPVNCVPPAGWIPIVVQAGDTLSSLAARYGTTPGLLAQANCLLTSNLASGYTLYAPPVANSPASNCAPYPGWVYAYIVQPGDTFYHIALSYGTTVEAVKFANCRVSNEIFPGERLWVPNVPTITPGVTIIPTFPTDTAVPTEPLTLTPLPFTATVIPTNTYPPPTLTPFSTTTP